ncbi:MAG TPA: histidine kinase, partial [Elusimicrobia bacterium]|nr:histidine kinase [Elusimicrobiota bacterium]
MAEKTYSTFDISEICGASPTTVADWIDAGELKAFYTPGGHRRVRKDDLLEFLKKYAMPIPKELLEDGRKKILVVDDDQAIINLITRFLKKLPEKYQFASAMDGFQAGQKLSEFEPDLIILDLMLPGIDGFQVCRNIRSNEKTKEMKILAITGYDSPENR